MEQGRHPSPTEGDGTGAAGGDVDALTGLATRPSVLRHAEEDLREALRARPLMSVVLCDLDEFLRIGDTHGRAATERVLVAMASLLQRMIRDVDRVARWGNDTFLLVLPLTGRAGAAKLAERIRRETAFLEVQGVDERMTASFGVAEMTVGETVEDLIARAEGALSEAKLGDGNQVATAPVPVPGI